MKSYLQLCDYLKITPQSQDFSLADLTIDSRHVHPGGVFCALQGAKVDGHEYIQAAIQQGVDLILAEKTTHGCSIPVLVIPDLAQRLSALAAWFYDYPSKKLKIIGVTGTNGKTSTTHYIAQFLHLLGEKVALIGTVGNGLWGQLQESAFTTPEPVSLQKQLAEFVNAKTTYVVMEVSSHALALNRVADLDFDTAVFTNLSQDHLDFHETMLAYAESKARLFAWPGLKTAVLNKDDGYSQLMVTHTALTTKVCFYSLRDNAESLVYAQLLQTSSKGFDIALFSPFGQAQIQTQLLGDFNISNLLAALTTLLQLGFSLPTLAQLSALLTPVKGRMEILRYEGLPLVVIDYAHTPDALEKALRALKIYQQPLWVVFGCGGNRDSDKRPKMARVAEQLADQVIVTEDNSRFEDPEVIFKQIFLGFQHPERVRLIPSRRAAIQAALAEAPKDAIVLLAGKGHETYLDLQGKKMHFDEREVVFTSSCGNRFSDLAQDPVSK